MNESNTYQAVRIGDIADWRLICSIGAGGMGAWLRHTNPTRDLVTLFDEKWSVEPEALLAQIENAVYDHPQVLDDFTADITVTAPRAVWVPEELVADDEEESTRLYNRVFSADDDDIMTENVGDAICIYTLVPGLNAFLQRTFPGARVHPHLGVLVKRFRERSAEIPCVFIDIRDGEADFVVVDNKKLVMAATHTWHHQNDLQYHLFNILDVFGLDPAETHVSLSGPQELKRELMQELRKTISYVMLTTMPGIGAKAGMPLAASLLLRN